jgi:hypothetical protein
MSHPDIEDLDRMVLLLSNKQGPDRLFIEAPKGSEHHDLAVCDSSILIAF